MLVEIITPEKKLFEGEAYLVKVPGTLGSFEILKNHAPIISTLVQGEIKVVTPTQGIILFEIERGLIEVKNNNVAILAEKSKSD